MHFKAFAMFGAILLLTAGPSTVAWSFGSGSSQKPSFEEGRDLALEGKYEAAIGKLQRVVEDDSQNADAWNMLGFSYRNTGEFDLAWDAYERALAIDPAHKGAHEYVGEWYLMQGDIASAKRQLKKLEALCPSECEERSTLASKVAAASS